MNKFKHQVISSKNVIANTDYSYVIFELSNEYIDKTDLLSVTHSEGLIYKINNIITLCLVCRPYTFNEDIVIDSIEYILNNNLAKFIQIDFEENNTWKCYFEITNKEMLLQLM